ncbi:Ras-related protein Rab-7b [Fukomys damarensis]|uniref:Ras-related protein Rab-7b n=1 Tax=Fukomys damarensis TaxID=885580 RepID=A0A091D9Y3_FUKDA|nr:Ras-related protein Rab-7b [Fukomys damarensis]
MNPRKKVDLKLIIVGALGVGKTSLLHQYVHKTFYEEYQTTLGASILSKVILLDDTTLKLQIWDTGGQERFRSMVSTFYKGSDGCILAFDVTDLESFEALAVWRDDVLAKIIPVEQSYPMVVLGNKIDLEDRKCPRESGGGGEGAHGSHSSEHSGDGSDNSTETVRPSSGPQVPQEIAQGWCDEKEMPYFEVSAKNDINVVQAFEVLARQALSRYRGTLENLLGDSIKLTPCQAKSRCC